MKMAMITTSFRRDLERCRMLCASVDRFVDPTVEHLLLIDRRDVEMFEPLCGPRRRIVVAEETLPWWLRRLPWSKRWWINFRGKPVRNWILQQIIKLSMPSYTDAEVGVFVDSDVTFVRPFAPEQVLVGGRVRLFRRPGYGNYPMHIKWHHAARRLLDVGGNGYTGSDYIGNVIPWRRDTVIDLHQHLQRVNRCPWQAALAGTLRFSEYILYGVYCEHVVGLGEPSEHEPSAEELCHCSWEYPIDKPEDLDAFFAKLGPQHVAVLVQSNLGIAAELYEARIKELQDTLSCQPQNCPS